MNIYLHRALLKAIDNFMFSIAIIQNQVYRIVEGNNIFRGTEYPMMRRSSLLLLNPV